MNWDKYFLDLCNTVASNSKCLSRQIGCIVTKNNRVISTGYNGPPSDFPHCGLDRWYVDKRLQKEIRKRGIDYPIEGVNDNICPRRILGYQSREGLEWCPAVHAEVNAVSGIKGEGYTLYLNTHVPCSNCLKSIITAGIEEIVCTGFEYYDDLSKYLVDNSDIKLRTFEL